MCNRGDTAPAGSMTEEACWVGYAYAMNNPVEAGACEKASAWPLSSFRGTLGLTEPSSFVDDGPVLACFDREIDPRAALRRRVENF